ncbi:hypothetical protein QZH41_010015 [Actinostola sp. cb2023]|nr:hypothetical protein QZH41_010015 [Actinostola sp. cb2023]
MFWSFGRFNNAPTSWNYCSITNHDSYKGYKAEVIQSSCFEK